MQAGTWVYIRSEPGLWTVGFYDGDGEFQPESDHGSPTEAAEQVRYLNGGDIEPDVREHVVHLIPHELMRVAAGNPIKARTVAGEDITVQLPTAEEFMAAQRAAVEALRLPEDVRPPLVTRDQAEALVKPLDV